MPHGTCCATLRVELLKNKKLEVFCRQFGAKQSDVFGSAADIATAAESIDAFVEGKNFEHYRSDAILRSAVERHFIIIGEALNQPLQLGPELSSIITSATQIVRRRLADGYFAIANESIWGIVERYFETLIVETNGILRERPRQQ